MSECVQLRPPSVLATHVLDNPRDHDIAAIEAAFGRHAGGLGLILVDLRGHALLEDYRSLRERCLAAAAHLGECMDVVPAARRDVLSRLGLGSDVPLGKGKASLPTAPTNTFSATLQLRWDVASGMQSSSATPATAPLMEASAAHTDAVATQDLKADVEALGLLLSRVAAGVARACDVLLLRRAAESASEAGQDTARSGAAATAETAAMGACVSVPAAAVGDEPARCISGSVEGFASGAGPLERTLLGAGTAKARLIHYRSADATWSGEHADACAARLPCKQTSSRGGSKSTRSSKGKGGAASGDAADAATAYTAVGLAGDVGSSSSLAGLAGLGSWQHWHYDYGLLTALCAPAYRLPGHVLSTADTHSSCTGHAACDLHSSINSSSISSDNSSKIDATTDGGVGSGASSSAASLDVVAGADACPACAAARDATGDDGAAYVDGCEGVAESAGLVVLAPAVAVRHAAALAAAASTAAAVGSLEPGATGPSEALPSGLGPSEAFLPVRVHIPPYCIAVQVGEAAQILSGGQLVATPHCVARPTLAATRGVGAASRIVGVEGAGAAEASLEQQQQRMLRLLSRQIFVVFLQPAWTDDMRPQTASGVPQLSGPTGSGAGAAADQCPCARARAAVLAGSEAATAAMGGIVPPLAVRWQLPCSCEESPLRVASTAQSPGGPVSTIAAGDGGGSFTFSDFSKATTAAFFGARGHQRSGHR